MTANPISLPDGPRSRVPFAFLRALQRDPIPFFSSIRAQFGDVASFRIGPQRIFLFCHPDAVREILVTRDRSFQKSRVLQRTRVILGEGLLTAEGDLHKRQRRLVQPAFNHSRIARYGEEMVARTFSAQKAWCDGQELDIHREMMRLTLSIVAKTLFDADVDQEAGEIGAALSELVALFPTLMNPLSDVLKRFPLPQTLRFRKALARLDRTIYGIIGERRRSGEDRGDLLSMLLTALDEEGDGGGMSDRQLRDEVMTLFLAGHETTANAMAWTFYLLAGHPDAMKQVRDELQAVIPGRLPAPADYPKLRYCENVIAESMRLYPPAWAVSRLAIEDVSIGGWLVPRGAAAVMSQALIHRDGRFWTEPEKFDPERFAGHSPMARPKFAYFPFGGGSRTCVGEGFAWMEGTLILATIARQWDMELLSNDVTPQATITLRPRDGIRVRMRRADAGQR